MARGVRKQENWVHSLFYKPSDIGAEVRHQVGQTHYRFCKTCWPVVGEIPQDISHMSKVGRELIGCCSVGKTGDRTPGIMQRHIQTHHPGLVPGCADHSSDSEHEAYDPAVAEAAARHLVGTDLDSFSCLSKPGMRAFLKSVCGTKRLPGRGAVTKAFEDLVKRCGEQVAEAIQAAKASGNHISLTADAWKNKGKKRRHYHCIFASWVDENWELHELCIGVVELCAPRNWEAYRNSVTEVLGRVGLVPGDVFAAVTDHDGSIRKGFAACGFTMVGCCCHDLQLPIQHVIPSLNENKRKKASPCGASSSSSTDSGSDSDAENKPELQKKKEPEKKKARRPPLTVTDPDRVALTNDLKPLFAKGRALCKQYFNLEDSYNKLEELATAAGVPFKRMAKESAVRWSSVFDNVTSQLYNDEAFAVHRAKVASLPQKYTHGEATTMQHCCGVLFPVKVATKVMEPSVDTCYRAGFYIPTVKAVTGQMAADVSTPLPEGAGSFGPQKHNKFIGIADLDPLVQRLKTYLQSDYKGNFDKLMAVAGGKDVLGVCAYLDPRFKDLAFIESPEEREAIKKKAKAMLLDMAASFRDEPDIINAARKEAQEAARVKAEQAASLLLEAQKAAEESGDVNLLAACGLPMPKAKAKGRGRGRGRARGSSAQAAAQSAPLPPPVVPAKRKLAEEVSDEAPGFSLKTLYRPQAEASSSATEKVISLQQVLKKEWLAYEKEQQVEDFEEDPAAWWKRKLKRDLPCHHIAVLARACLGIPGSSAGI